MRRLSPLPAIMLAALVAAYAAAASGQDAREDFDNLMDMLAAVPDTNRVRAGPVIADYVDYRALERAGGVASPDSVAALDAMDDAAFQDWSTALSRVDLDPLNLDNELPAEAVARQSGGSSSAFRNFPAVLGIDWFAVDRAVAVGGPPAAAVVLGGGPELTDLGAMATALADRDFAVEIVGGVPVWHRFDDFEVRVDAIDGPDPLGFKPSDPFGVQHGFAARIAGLTGALAGSRDWTLIEDVIEARQGNMPSLADDPYVQAAAAAITDQRRFDGVLVRALFSNVRFTAAGVSSRKLGPFASDQQLSAFADELLSRMDGGLPFYRLAAVADRQDGSDEIALIALVYDDRETAREAASAVADAVANYVPLRRKQRLADAFDLGISTHVFQAGRGGPAVAVIGLSDFDQGSSPRPGRLFRMLQIGFLYLEPDYLIVAAE